MVIEESISAENTKTKNKKYTGYSDENGIERLGRSRGGVRVSPRHDTDRQTDKNTKNPVMVSRDIIIIRRQICRIGWTDR